MVQNDSEVVLSFKQDTITLYDNSILLVKEVSIVPMTGIKTFLCALWSGRVRAKVNKFEPRYKFEIATPSAVCAVRGTDFSVEVGKDNITEVKSYSGRVAVKESSGVGEEVLLEKGQQTTIEPGQAPAVPGPLSEKREKEEKKPREKKEKEKIKVTEAKEAGPAEEALVERAGKPGEPKKLGFTMTGSFGAVVLMDPDAGEAKVFYKIGFLPEITFGKIGIGLDFVFYFDEKNNLRTIEWDEWSDVIEKVWYIRYGHKGDPVFAYLGGLKSATLGHGLIINSYSNMLDYPDKRHIGLQLDVDLGKVGAETILSDINRNPVAGARLFFRPFHTSGLFFLNRLALGISAATDQNPDEYSKTTGDEVTVIGADLDLPVLKSSVMEVVAFTDVAQMELGNAYKAVAKNRGKGYTMGLKGTILEYIAYRGEYRILENNFIPGYFDTYYEIDRASKPYIIGNSKDPLKKGPYLEFLLSLMQKASISFSYENYNNDPAGYYPYLRGALNLSPSLLMNRFTFGVSYAKRNVKDLEDFFSAKQAIMVTELGYSVSPQVYLVLVQRQTFDNNGMPTKNTTIETRIQF